jgi:transposase-like protein
MNAKLTAQAEQLARELATQASTIDDLNALFRGMMKSALECMLDAEMDAHLTRPGQDTPLPLEPPPDQDKSPHNRRNGHSKKTIQGEMGDIPLDIPRDRHGTFDPVLIGKYQRRLASFDEKILALYAKGLTTRDIQDIVEQL